MTLPIHASGRGVTRAPGIWRVSANGEAGSAQPAGGPQGQRRVRARSDSNSSVIARFSNSAPAIRVGLALLVAIDVIPRPWILGRLPSRSPIRRSSPRSSLSSLSSLTLRSLAARVRLHPYLPAYLHRYSYSPTKLHPMVVKWKQAHQARSARSARSPHSVQRAPIHPTPAVPPANDGQ